MFQTTNQISFFRPSDITRRRRLGHARQQHFLALESFSEFKRRCFKDGDPKILDLPKMEEPLLHQLHCHILFSAKIYHVCTIINYTYCTWYFSTTQVLVISVTPGQGKQLKFAWKSMFVLEELWLTHKPVGPYPIAWSTNKFGVP